MEVMLEGSRTDPGPPLHQYTVTVITSDIRNAGTDADVFVNIKGKARLLCITCSRLEQPGWNKQNSALCSLTTALCCPASEVITDLQKQWMLHRTQHSCVQLLLHSRSDLA